MKNILNLVVLLISIGIISCKIDGDNKNNYDTFGTITITPNTGNIVVGTELTANYSGSENVFYQWKRNNNNIFSNVGTNSNKFTPTSVGSYTVTVSTGYKTKTSEPVIVKLLELSGNITIVPNSIIAVNSELTATYNGNETVNFQWKKDGSNIGVSSTLNPNKFTPTEIGVYTVTVSLTGYTALESDLVSVWNQPTTVTTLSTNTWENGDLTNETEEWFTFTATATKTYIHLNYITTASVIVQVYNELGIASGSTASGYLLSRFSRDLEIGKKYYIRVQPSSKGTYRIAVSAIPESPNVITLPTENILPLIINTWADCETSNGNFQWVSFTANSNTQYLHILASGTATVFWFNMYGSNGGSLGSYVYLEGSGTTGPFELETGKTYYVRFSHGYPGTFKVSFNGSITPPPIVLPTESIIQLTANTWANGTTNGGAWYRFSANARTQYIHFNFITATGARVNIYDRNGNIIGNSIRVPVERPNFFQELENGSVYFLRVTQETYHGDFQIVFNTSAMPPAITLPSDGIIELTSDIWATRSIAVAEKQWFKFTANSNTQYIHMRGIDSGYYLPIRLYDRNGNGIGDPISIRSTSTYLSRAVTIGQVYYVKITDPGYGFNDYRISFNNSETPPALE